MGRRRLAARVPQDGEGGRWRPAAGPGALDRRGSRPSSGSFESGKVGGVGGGPEGWMQVAGPEGQWWWVGGGGGIRRRHEAWGRA